MALFGYEKSTLKRNLVIGGVAAIGLYLVFRFGLKKLFMGKGVNLRGDKNFVGADGVQDDNGTFIAKRYDPERLNSDGTKGATWIGYNNSDIVGYWKAGKVKIGDELSQLI